MSESLRLLTKRERMRESLAFLSKSLIGSFICKKTSDLLRKPLSEFPTLAKPHPTELSPIPTELHIIPTELSPIHCIQYLLSYTVHIFPTELSSIHVPTELHIISTELSPIPTELNLIPRELNFFHAELYSSIIRYTQPFERDIASLQNCTLSLQNYSTVHLSIHIPTELHMLHPMPKLHRITM